MTKNVYIYFHICTLNNWEYFSMLLYNAIINSGLINIITKINVVVLGTQVDRVKELLNNEKVNIIFHDEITQFYERPCLLLMREHALKEDCIFLYIHSKGIGHGDKQNILDWINQLLYFNIERHTDCLKLLETVDTCGVDLQTVYDDGWGAGPINPHYCGNFWWANSYHIKELPDTIPGSYIAPEMWIGRKVNAKMGCLWHSRTNHYNLCYPKELYVDKTDYFEYIVEK